MQSQSSARGSYMQLIGFMYSHTYIFLLLSSSSSSLRAANLSSSTASSYLHTHTHTHRARPAVAHVTLVSSCTHILGCQICIKQPKILSFPSSPWYSLMLVLQWLYCTNWRTFHFLFWQIPNPKSTIKNSYQMGHSAHRCVCAWQ